jgi:hypothetical protein
VNAADGLPWFKNDPSRFKLFGREMDGKFRQLLGRQRRKKRVLTAILRTLKWRLGTGSGVLRKIPHR